MILRNHGSSNYCSFHLTGYATSAKLHLLRFFSSFYGDVTSWITALLCFITLVLLYKHFRSFSVFSINAFWSLKPFSLLYTKLFFFNSSLLKTVPGYFPVLQRHTLGVLDFNLVNFWTFRFFLENLQILHLICSIRSWCD